MLYVISTLAAALVAVIASFAFPTTLVLNAPAAAGAPPGGIVVVLKKLCLVSSFAAAGVSGVAGGSLLLIPMATALFGIATDVAMQVVAIGFVISVVQDSAETALNSSTDVVLTAAGCAAATGESLNLELS